MALPKRLRDQLKAEGKTIDDVAREVEERTGDFGLNETINGGQSDDVNVDDLPDADEDLPEAPPRRRADAATDPADEVEAGTDTPDDEPPATTPTEDAGDTAETPGEYINPFDVGLEDEPEDPPAAAAPQQPAQTPPAAQEQPAPQPAPQQPAPQAPQQGQNFQFTKAELQALGGQQNAEMLLGIISRMTQPQSEQLRRDVMQARLDGFRQNIAASVPQYREIITSKAWKRYLKTYSPMARATVQEALLAADAQLDRRAVIGIFEDFRARHAPREQPNDPSAGKVGKSRPKPADLATPGKSATNNGGVNPGGKRYKFKESDIQRLDDQRRRKKIDAVTYHDKVAEYDQALARGEVELGA